MVKRQHKADKRTDRTTKMLLAVWLLFLLTELPQGILGLLSGVLGWCFFVRCYNLLGDMMDLLALVNGAINFILYCSMSRQFRQTFRQLVLQRRFARFLPPTASHSDSHNQNTYVTLLLLLLACFNFIIKVMYLLMMFFICSKVMYCYVIN